MVYEADSSNSAVGPPGRSTVRRVRSVADESWGARRFGALGRTSFRRTADRRNPYQVLSGGGGGDGDPRVADGDLLESNW